MYDEPKNEAAEDEVEKLTPEEAQAEKLVAKHDFFLRDFDAIEAAQHDERQQCLEDRRFYSIVGAQWEGSLDEQFKNKLKFELNKTHLAVLRIINEYRNNRISVSFVPKKGKKDSGNEQLADAVAGLYRADEQDSCAEEATDNAFEEAVGGGYGAFRLCTEYEDEDEEGEQRVRFKPIFDADSCVFFDLGARRQDKSDAKRCYVLTPMTVEDFKNEYGEDPVSWPHSVSQFEFDWFAQTANTVYVAEVYEVEKAVEKYQCYVGIEGEQRELPMKELEENPLLADEMMALGFKPTEVKERKKRRVHKYLMTGSRILEDCGFIAGPNIPVIPVYGKRWYVDNVERFAGHVRLVKDGQRLFNVQVSKLGEMSVSSGIGKPILTPQQVAGHQGMWEDDPVKNFAYLLLNPIIDAQGNEVVSGPIAYTQPPQLPPAMATLLQITDSSIKEIMGNPQAGEQIVSNIATKTVELVQQRLDMQSYIFVSNMAKAMQRAGEVWLGMAKDITVEEGREMKTVGPNGEVGSVELMRPIADKETGDIRYENNLEDARFDVVAKAGPSSSSKREATVRNLKEMMAIVQDPQTLQVLSAMVMLNMEGEGISDVREFFRKQMLRMGVVKPTEEEAKKLLEEQANQPPDANSELLKAAADQAEAEAVKARADTVYTIAKVDKLHAEVLAMLAEVNQAKQQLALDAAKTATEIGAQMAAPAQTSIAVPQPAADEATPL